MSKINMGALAAVIIQADADIRENLPLPPSAPITSDQEIALATAAQAKIAACDAWFKKYPGIVRATCRVLAFFSGLGWAWATELNAIIGAAPGEIATIDSWAPTVVGFLTAFQPAPQPIDQPPER